jgi:hypothetical protein
VTFFLAGFDTTTLPLWILGALRKTQQLPEVNAVAARSPRGCCATRVRAGACAGE